MTQDEIIEMANEVGFVAYGEDCGEYRIPTLAFHSRLERFAKLVAAKEREACAKLLDEEALDAFTFDDSLARATENYAELIRARAGDKND